MGLGSNGSGGDDDDGYADEYLSKMSHPSLSQSLSLAQSPEQQQRQRHRQEEKKEKIAAPDSVMTAVAHRLLA